MVFNNNTINVALDNATSNIVSNNNIIINTVFNCNIIRVVFHNTSVLNNITIKVVFSIIPIKFVGRVRGRVIRSG
jgi:hypothetical protein